MHKVSPPVRDDSAPPRPTPPTTRGRRQVGLPPGHRPTRASLRQHGGRGPTRDLH